MCQAEKSLAGPTLLVAAREHIGYVYSEVFDLKPTSGLSHAQSCLKNPAHLSHFFILWCPPGAS